MRILPITSPKLKLKTSPGSKMDMSWGTKKNLWVGEMKSKANKVQDILTLKSRPYLETLKHCILDEFKYLKHKWWILYKVGSTY